MWFTRVSIKNPYFATVVMLALMVLGLVGLKGIPVEEFPDVKFPIVVVSTTYTGASPEVVEADISKPVEEALNTLSGIKTIRSYSMEGSSTVVAEFDLSVDPGSAVQDVRDKVATTSAKFKSAVDKPVISKVDVTDKPMISLNFVSDQLSLRQVTDWVNQVAVKKLQTVPGVGDVKVVGGSSRQVNISINPYKLQSLDLTITQVNNAIQSANGDYPSGDVRTSDKIVNLRLNGKLKDPSKFRDIVVGYHNNVPIKLEDVAEVQDSQAELTSLSLVNGKRSVGVQIKPVDRANVVEVAEGVHRMVDTLDQIKPDGIQVIMSYDRTDSIKRSLRAVEDTLFEGTLLTVLIVFLFLKSWRSTVITGLTLPIALLGTMFAIYVFGFTLNKMSLLALSLSVGLLIDDAIVVRENIVRHLHMGKSHIQASLDGTKEIGLAVFATTLTLVAVFLPVGFMQGVIGKFFMQFGITVTIAVLISLLVSFTLDPMLSSVWHEPKDGGWLANSFVGKFLDWFERRLEDLNHGYVKLLTLCLAYRKTVLTISLAMLVGSFMLAGQIGGEFMPKSDQGKFSITFKTATGSNLEYTETKVKQVTKILVDNIPEIQRISGGVNQSFGDGTNNASLTVNVGDKDTRTRSLKQISDQTRDLAKQIGGIEVQNVMALGSPGGDSQPINLDIKGDNIEALKSIANDIITKISLIPGTAALQSSYQKGDPAIDIYIRRDIAANTGVNLSDVGAALSSLFAGNKVSTWEDPNTGDNYDVVVQIPQKDRGPDVLDILNVPSNNLDSNGLPYLVSLSTLTTKKIGESPRQVERVDLQRKVTITGDITTANKQEVFAQIAKITDSYKMPTGYSFDQSGENQDMKDSFGYALAALGIGILFIYMILTAQFRSFTLPIVIMMSLPLSFIGVFVALYITGSTINMFSIIGIIMLMGLATKNGILLVDFTNQRLGEGQSLHQSLLDAGTTRMRPIIMTSFAMIFGMLPLALSQAIGSETNKPMAIAIIGGMITSTLLTLIVVPVIFSYFVKIKKNNTETEKNH